MNVKETDLHTQIKMGHPKSSTITNFVSCILLLSSQYTFRTVSSERKVALKEDIPALLAFGDSIVDPGNNNGLLFTLIKSNFAPYGRDFEGGKATGRFCNGRIPTDFLADALGLKKVLPGYLDPDLKDEDLLTGVSFAISACGFDPFTPRLFNVKSMKYQLKMFKEYIGKLKDMVGEDEKNSIVANSIYLIVAGSDDIANTFFTTPFIRDLYDVHSYTDLVRNSASSFVQRLYKLGARKIFVTNLPPIACLPSQRTLGGGFNRDCPQNREEATMLLNNKLAAELESLGDTLPDSEIVCMDLYGIFLDLVKNGSKYGFEVVDKGCCGSGLIEVALLCNPLSSTCEDPSKYLFWDSYHPTERAYKMVVDKIVDKYMKHFF